MRTVFFGGYNKRDEPFQIENLDLDFKEKDIPKNSRHIKLTFIEILNSFKNLEDIDESSYINWRKNSVI